MKKDLLEKTEDGNYLDTWSGKVYSPLFLNTYLAQKILYANRKLMEWEDLYIFPYHPYVEIGSGDRIILNLQRGVSCWLVEDIETVPHDFDCIDIKAIDDEFYVEEFPNTTRIYSTTGSSYSVYYDSLTYNIRTFELLQDIFNGLRLSETYHCDKYLNSIFSDNRYCLWDTGTNKDGIVLYDTWNNNRKISSFLSFDQFKDYINKHFFELLQ